MVGGFGVQDKNHKRIGNKQSAIIYLVNYIIFHFLLEELHKILLYKLMIIISVVHLGSLIRFSFEEGKIVGLKEFKDKKFERFVS